MIPQPTHFRVRSYELDGLGHLNHSVFLNYFEEARFDALEQVGISALDLQADGWGVHVVRAEVDFRRECRQGEELRVETRVERLRNSSMVLEQRMEKHPSGEVAAEARIVAVWVRQGEGPTRIPETVRDSLTRLRERFGSQPSERRP